MPDIELTETIEAPPGEVWKLVADPTHMDGLTAECVAMEWVGGASGPALGARFRGRNRSGWRRWTTTCTVVRLDPDREIAWHVSFGPLSIARWGYRVESGPTASTTLIHERFEDERDALVRAFGPLVRGTSDTEGRNRANMAATLAAIKARAESR